MPNIYKRLKLIREKKKLNQSNFAKLLGIGQSTLAMMEVGKRDIHERHIKTICSICNIREEWLKYGKGSMFTQNGINTINTLVQEHNLCDLEAKILETYINLPNNIRQSAKEFIIAFANSLNLNNNKEVNDFLDKNPKFKPIYRMVEDKNNSKISDDFDIEAELESYRKELEHEKKTREESLALPDIKES